MNDKKLKPTLDSLPKSNGMTVPDGYFADFKKRLMAELPDMPAEKGPAERTLWQKVRPYVYLAAMFAGTYLMLNLFSISQKLRPAAADSAQNSPALLAEVVNTNTLAYVDDYISMTEYDLYDQLFESGFEIPETL